VGRSGNVKGPLTTRADEKLFIGVNKSRQKHRRAAQMFLFSLFCKRYKLSKRLHGHEDAILSLGISRDGSFLASGGTYYASSN
jgi:hypothetical protein